MFLSIHGGSSDTAPAAASQPPANLPPVADPHVRLFAELFGDPAVHATRWFIAAMLLGLVVLGLVLTLFRLVPLKTAVPYLVEVRPDGVVTRVARAREYQPGSAMLKAELARWVEKVLVIDPFLTRGNQREATKSLRGKAVAEHRALLQQDDPFARLLKDPTLVRTVVVTGVDLSQEGIAFVYATSTERTAGASKEPVRWRFTVHYSTVTPETEEALMANPAGLAITHLLRTQDRS